MHALVLVNVNLHTICELPTFFHSKNVMGARKFRKWVTLLTWPWSCPFEGWLSPLI